MERGWVKLWRRIEDSAVFANPELLKLFILCLLKANHARAHVCVDGQTEPAEVLPGQFITGRFALHADYYPKHRKSNKSPSTVWRWLKTLKNMGKVNIKTNSRYSLVSVCNWHTYQSAEMGGQPNGTEMDSRWTAGEQPVHTNKNDKNDKNDKKNVPAPEILAEIEQLAFKCYGAMPYQVMDWLDMYEHDWIVKAIKRTLDIGKRPPPYTQVILERWRGQGGMDEKEQAGKEREYGIIE